MKKLTIRWRIMGSFAVILALMVIMAAVAYTRLKQIERQSILIETDSLPGLTYTNQILLDRIANYSLTQEFVLQTDVTAKQKLQAAILASRAYLDTLITDYATSITSTPDRELYESYKGAVEVYRTVQDSVLKAGFDAKSSREENVKKISADLYPEFAKA